MPINADNRQNDNNDDENQQNGQQNNPVTMAGSGKAQPSTAGRVAGFSSGQPQQAGSGRFTNLSKYMSSNQGAGERIGSQIQNQVNRNVDTQTSNISDQNQKIRQGIDSGKASNTQGNEFNTQLGGINQNLQSFKSMEDRAGFDQGSKDAQSFTQAPNFNQFQNIQAGSGVDQDALNQSQGQAQIAGQDLSKLTGDNIGRIGTEQGRYELLRNRFAPGGRSYAAGNARLDQALLQNAPGNVVGQMRNQFVNQNQASSALGNTIGAQGQDVGAVVKDETDLLTNLNTVTQSNQDIFNEKLGQKGNIDFIQDLRKKKYEEYVKQLRTGNVGRDLTKELGLDQLNTYKPVGAGQVQAMGFNPNNNTSITQYNADLAANAQNYLKQGQEAKTMQDIATEDDYAGYQALANIAQRDTGKLAGASQLDRAVQASVNSNNQSLSDVISGYDQNFKDKYGGKKFSSVGAGTTAADDGGTFVQNIPSLINRVFNPEGFSSQDPGGGKPQLSGIYEGGPGSRFDDFYSQINSANSSGKGGVGVASSTVNIDDYIKAGDLSQGEFQYGNIQNQGKGTSAANSRQAVENARNQTNLRLRAGLDDIIKTSGVKNNININQDDSANEVLKRANKYSRLVK